MTPISSPVSSFSTEGIPSLQTQRLLLRPMRITDWPDYLRFMLSARAQHIVTAATVEKAWGMFCADHAQWAFFGCGALMIERRTDCQCDSQCADQCDGQRAGQCLGQVGINSGPLFAEWELGWLLYEGAEGQGYAAEAATALRDWAKGPRALPGLVSYIAPGNARSGALAVRLGARLDPDAPRRDPSDLVYRYF